MPEVLPALAQLQNNFLSHVQGSEIRIFDQYFSKDPEIIKLTLGEPNFEVADHVKAATIQAVQENDSHYAVSWGHLALREAIADYLADRYAVSVDAASEVVVTVGASEAIYAVLGALFNPGDKLIIPTPTFPLYEMVAKSFGLEIVHVNTQPDFVLTAEKLTTTLAEHPDAKAVIVNYPSNPTGITYRPEQLKALAEVLKEHELLVIADEIYAELSYQYEHTSLANLLPAQTIMISGLSKAHAMTGYRMGYVVGPAALMAQIGKLHQCVVTTPPGPMMAAALEALCNGQADTERMRQTYLERRNMLQERLTKMQINFVPADGAFYLFMQIPAAFGQDDVKFVYDLADKAKLGLIPGSVFGPGGEGYVRMSYAAATETLEEAMNRLEEYVSALNK